MGASGSHVGARPGRVSDGSPHGVRDDARRNVRNAAGGTPKVSRHGSWRRLYSAGPQHYAHMRCQRTAVPPLLAVRVSLRVCRLLPLPCPALGVAPPAL